MRISSASWNAGFIGKINEAGNRYFAKSNLVDLDNMTETHIATFRNKSTYKSLPNIVEIRLVGFGGGSVKENGKSALIALRKGATITGLSFSDIDTVNSVMEWSTAGTYTLTTGMEIVNRPMNSRGNGPNVQLLPKSDITILLLPGEILTITGTGYSNAVDDVIGAIWWEERH